MQEGQSVTEREYTSIKSILEFKKNANKDLKNANANVDMVNIEIKKFDLIRICQLHLD